MANHILFNNFKYFWNNWFCHIQIQPDASTSTYPVYLKSLAKELEKLHIHKCQALLSLLLLVTMQILIYLHLPTARTENSVSIDQLTPAKKTNLQNSQIQFVKKPYCIENVGTD